MSRAAEVAAELAATVEAAEARIRARVRETYLEPSAWLSGEGGATVTCKLENLQHTGSFKVRGAMNLLLSLSEQQRERGVVAASTGNHGAAVAFALHQLRSPGTVFVPEDASPVKVRAIEEHGIEVRRVAGDPVAAEIEGRRFASESGRTYVSPYNDPRIVAGQGTVGAELDRQAVAIDAVFVAVGGGGLIAGIAGYLKRRRPDVEIVGCSPANSPVMIESVRAGRVLDMPSLPTLSDGTAGGMEEGAITLELCSELVDRYVMVTEDEIAAALRGFVDAHHQLIEGAAAVAIAAYLQDKERYAGKNVIIVICGGNIALETLRRLL